MLTHLRLGLALAALVLLTSYPAAPVVARKNPKAHLARTLRRLEHAAQARARQNKHRSH